MRATFCPTVLLGASVSIAGLAGCTGETNIIGAVKQESESVMPDPDDVPTWHTDPYGSEEEYTGREAPPVTPAPPPPPEYLAKRAAFEAAAAARIPEWAAAGLSADEIKERRGELKWKHLRPEWTKWKDLVPGAAD